MELVKRQLHIQSCLKLCIKQRILKAKQQGYKVSLFFLVAQY